MAVREEGQSAFRAQQPSGLGEPALRVAPGPDSVFTHDDVCTAVGQGQSLTIGLHEWELGA